MADYPELAALLSELPSVEKLVRRAFEAGMAVGDRRATEREHERLAKAFQSAGIPLQVAPPAQDRPSFPAGAAAPPVVVNAGRVLEYGAVAKPVRAALKALGYSEEGFSPQEVLERLLLTTPDSPLDVEQVRTALKVSAKRHGDEVARLARGRYLHAEFMPAYGLGSDVQTAPTEEAGAV